VKTVTFEIRSANEDFEDTLKQLESGQPAESATYVFTNPELLWQTLNEERWRILKYLCGKKPMQIDALATHLERDLNAVRNDVEAMLNAGVIDREVDGICFPYKEIKVDFLFKAV
jgi:predicted transcriptional regulator